MVNELSDVDGRASSSGKMAGRFSGSWHHSDDLEGSDSVSHVSERGDEPGLADEWNDAVLQQVRFDGSHVAAAPEVDELAAVRYERAEWLDRYWDMGDDEFKQFVCVEPGIALAPGTGMVLLPGETGELVQTIARK